MTAAICLVSLLVAAACPGTRQTEPPPFDSGRAFEYLERQVAFGPRVPGTEAHREAAAWLEKTLRTATPHVSLQHFSGVFGGVETDGMVNIIASFYPGMTSRILLCAHWDCRHHADRDPDPANRQKPVPGANDGASGVAVLLEMAAILSEHEPPVGVDIVLFDGEDGGSYGDNSTWLLGSRHFADVMPASYRPERAVLLDMIGDRDLDLTRDVNSMYAAPKLWKRVESVCETIGIPFAPGESDIVDDHIPLIRRGIPAVDIIDFNYPWWHTVADTPDKCSAESLGKIGRLVLELVYGTSS